jgi:DNA end-binding protein Ku
MPRSLWNGTVSFGVVRVPVKLHSATESKTIRFNERHVGDGAAIEHRRICAKEGKEVPYKEIVKGFEVSSGRYVVLTKEEIGSADGPAARTIEIEHFVQRDEIDPIYYERSYYLGPGGPGNEAYGVLHAALKDSDRVGIGRFVFHNKSHLVAIRALDEALTLHTMRYAEELADADSEELEVQEPSRKPSELEVQAARALVDQLASSFEPDTYEDTYREAVLALIDRKAAGEAIVLPESEPTTPENDLLGALRASLEKHGRGAKAKPTPKAKGTPKSKATTTPKAAAKPNATAKPKATTKPKAAPKPARKPVRSSR